MSGTDKDLRLAEQAIAALEVAIGVCACMNACRCKCHGPEYDAKHSVPCCGPGSGAHLFCGSEPKEKE